MTQRPDVARGREIIARWCSLAEQRLEYLTKMYETGRWRRYHSERDFLENIQEAKAAVQSWRDLLSREASRDNMKIDVSWLGRKKVVTEHHALPRPTLSVSSEAALVSPEVSRSVFVAMSQAIDVSSKEPPAEPTIDIRAAEPALPPAALPPEALPPAVEPQRDDPIDLALNVLGIHNRYPSLRNVM
jgi:uncharacterized repeat protein (TIGR03809 family)